MASAYCGDMKTSICNNLRLTCHFKVLKERNKSLKMLKNAQNDFVVGNFLAGGKNFSKRIRFAACLIEFRVGN